MPDLYDPDTPGPYPAPVTHAPPVRRRRWPRLNPRLTGRAADTAAAIGGFCIGLFLLGLWWSVTNNDTPALQVGESLPNVVTDRQVPTAVPQSRPVEQAPRSVLAGDGLWEVGRDFKPGVFQSSTPADSFCYVERLDADGEVVESWTFQAGRPAVITVKPGDRWTLVSGCGSWKRVR